MADPTSDRDVLLNELADEFAARYRRGERPALTEYVERHPELADDIRDVFPTLVEMEVVKATAQGPGTAPDINLPPLEYLGDFHILREIGHGGMGVVYEAEQISLGRRVALKLLTQRMLRDKVQKRRFEREAKSAARLHHTNIVPVFGSGDHEGTPYYVMQFIHGLGLDVVTEDIARLESAPTTVPHRRDVSGVAQSLMTGQFSPSGDPEQSSGSISRAVADTSDITVSMTQPGTASSGSSSGRHPRKLTYWQGVARIGTQVADALDYAHRQGIIHRDVKPSNILLDLSGTAWITDFGLAKSDDHDNLTRTGDMLGTLRYMPPEAFDGKNDVRSDVYGLGVTIYEMLALRPAYDQHDRNKLIKAVTSSEPPRLRLLRPAVPRDLETIVHKAIDRDPARRYRTAAEMGADLQRFLDDEPIKARELSTMERTWRWCRRYPLNASLLAGIMLVFVAGFAGVFWQWREAKGREAEAILARNDANQTRNASARQAASLLLDRGIEDARGGEPVRALHLFVQALQALPADDPLSAPLERAIRLNIAAWAETVPALEHIWTPGPRFQNSAFSRDGSMVAMAISADQIQCFRTDSGEPVGPPAQIRFGLGTAMAFSPDGGSLWIGSPGSERADEEFAVHRIDPRTGREIPPILKSDGPIDRIACAPNGRYVVGSVLSLDPDDQGPRASATGERKWRTTSLRVWDVGNGHVVRSAPVLAKKVSPLDQVNDSYVDIAPDNSLVTAWVQVGSSYQGLSFRIDGTETPRPIGQFPILGADKSLHFHPTLRSGLTIHDGQIHRWSVGDPMAVGPGAPTPIRQFVSDLSADGRSFCSLTDGRVFDSGAWPPRPSGVRFAHPGWQRRTNPKNHSPDGRFALTWRWPNSEDGRLWRLPRPMSRPTLPLAEFARRPERKDYFFHATFDPQRFRAALWWHSDSYFRTHEIFNVRVVDVANGAVRDTSMRQSNHNRSVEFSPDGRYLATSSDDGTARVWDAATGRMAGPPLRHDNIVTGMAFTPDGDTLAAGDFGPAGLVRFWDWRSGKESRKPFKHDDIVLHVKFSPDGRYLGVNKSDDWSGQAEFIVWDLTTDQVAFRTGLYQSGERVAAGCLFRPDGRVVVARDVNGVLRAWEVPLGRLIGERLLAGIGVTRFSPDGRILAAVAHQGVRLFDGETLSPLPAGNLNHPESIRDIAFSPDGTLLLSGHDAGSAQLWDIATHKAIGPPAALIGPIRAVAFSPDGKTCMCLGADATIRRWPAPTAFDEPNLQRVTDRICLLTGQRMDESQGLDFVPPADWQALRTKLVGTGSTALGRPRSDEEWHDNVAADAEQDGDVFGAEWHLARLAQSRPKDWTIPARRGRVLAAAGQLDEAAAAYSTALSFAPSPQNLSDWLRARASDEEAANRLDAALWNLDRAIALTPADWTLYAARALLSYKAGQRDRAAKDVDEIIRRHADDIDTIDQVAAAAGNAGDWGRAARVFAEVANGNDVTIDHRYHRALVSLKAGDSEGYHAVCLAVAERLAPIGPNLSRSHARRAAILFALRQDSTNDWSKPLAWIDHALVVLSTADHSKPQLVALHRQVKHIYLNTRGALLYRAGRFEEAAKTLRDAMTYHADGGDYFDWLFLALTEHRLGHADAAQTTANKTRETRQKVENNVWVQAEVELLAAELDKAIPPDTK